MPSFGKIHPKLTSPEQFSTLDSKPHDFVLDDLWPMLRMGPRATTAPPVWLHSENVNYSFSRVQILDLRIHTIHKNLFQEILIKTVAIIFCLLGLFIGAIVLKLRFSGDCFHKDLQNVNSSNADFVETAFVYIIWGQYRRCAHHSIKKEHNYNILSTGQYPC